MKNMKIIGELLRTQENCATEHPMFCVQVCERMWGFDPDYGEGYGWFDPEDRELGEQPAPSDEWNTNLEKIGYKDFWKTVAVAFTEYGCKQHLRLNGHNYRHYKATRIYVESFHRNPEMKVIREFLISLPKPDDFFPVKCPVCGWIGMSNEAAGGEPIADTGDYSDIICPKCVRDVDGPSIPVDEIRPAEYATYIGTNGGGAL